MVFYEVLRLEQYHILGVVLFGLRDGRGHYLGCLALHEDAEQVLVGTRVVQVVFSLLHFFFKLGLKDFRLQCHFHAFWRHKGRLAEGLHGHWVRGAHDLQNDVRAADHYERPGHLLHKLARGFQLAIIDFDCVRDADSKVADPLLATIKRLKVLFEENISLEGVVSLRFGDDYLPKLAEGLFVQVPVTEHGTEVLVLRDIQGQTLSRYFRFENKEHVAYKRLVRVKLPETRLKLKNIGPGCVLLGLVEQLMFFALRPQCAHATLDPCNVLGRGLPNLFEVPGRRARGVAGDVAQLLLHRADFADHLFYLLKAVAGHLRLWLGPFDEQGVDWGKGNDFAAMVLPL